MKIACTGDWHLHPFQEFSKPISVKWDDKYQRYINVLEGREMNSRLFNTLNGICDIRDYCVRYGIKYVLNAGDIFHKRGILDVETFNAAYQVIKSFSDYGIDLICIAGNHDQVDASDNPATSIHTLSKICTVIEQPSVFCTPKLRVCCLPYSKNKDLILDSLDEFAQNENRSESILLAHLGVGGAAVGSGMYLMTDEYTLDDLKARKWKYVVLGHYHRPQLLTQNAFYCGTPVQNSFSDELPDEENGGYNGFFVIDTEKENSIEFIPIRQPRFITVKTLEELSNASDENYYRLIADPQLANDLKNVDLGSSVKVEFDKTLDETDKRSDISLVDSPNKIVEKYIEQTKDGWKDLDGEILARVGSHILAEVVNGVSLSNWDYSTLFSSVQEGK